MFIDFFTSTVGSITTGVVLLIVISLFTLNFKKKQLISTQALAYAAICLAIGVILSNVKLFSMPYGGTVTACSMFFVTLIGYWFGVKVGILASVTYGLLQLILGPYVVHPIQLLLDYPIAFGALGLSGLFRNAKFGLQIGYVCATLSRWVFSTISGVIFFAEYAGDLNPFVYSLIYNISYAGPEILITLILISIPAFANAVNVVKDRVNNQTLSNTV